MPQATLMKTSGADVQATISKGELAALESRVRQGLKSFMDVGKALAEINETNAYRLRNYLTFEEYVVKEFGFSLRHGQRMIAAAETAVAIRKATGDTPSNESAVRVLQPVANDPKALEKVQKKLEAAGSSIKTATAEAIQKVVDTIVPKQKAMLDDKPEPKPDVVLPTTNDTCPHCGKIPDGYMHGARGWSCAACGEVVLLGVTAAVLQACPDCGHALVAGDPFCRQCGSVLEMAA